MTIKTSIVIPAYKEKKLKIIIPLILKNLSWRDFIFEIIIVDNDSKDVTIKIFNKLKKDIGIIDRLLKKIKLEV